MFKNKWIDKALFQTIGMVHQKNIYIMEPRKILDRYLIYYRSSTRTVPIGTVCSAGTHDKYTVDSTVC